MSNREYWHRWRAIMFQMMFANFLVLSAAMTLMPNTSMKLRAYLPGGFLLMAYSVWRIVALNKRASK